MSERREEGARKKGGREGGRGDFRKGRGAGEKVGGGMIEGGRVCE